MAAVRRRAFTLIELLVVVAILAVLAAILFPVFARAKDAAKGTVCLSNLRQLGLGLTMYRDDHDGVCFFFAHNTDLSRSQPWAPFGATRENRWWNQILPYTRTRGGLLVCPSDSGRAPHSLEDGRPEGEPFVPRSYVANRALDSLSESQVERASEIAMVTEKSSARWADDSWYEPPKNLYNKVSGGVDLGEPVLAFGRHADAANAMFFDGHAKRVPRGLWLSDPCGEPMSGVELIRLYPIPLVPGRTIWHEKCPR